MENAKGEQFVADFPVGVTRPVQYESSIKSQSVYMSLQQLVPYDRVRDYFLAQCGIAISTGSVSNFNKEYSERLEEFDAMAKRVLKSQPVLHADETVINVNGKLVWLHNVSNDKWTLFNRHAKRGGIAIKEMGVLEDYKGTLCHDHWKPYFQLRRCRHSLCNAHHLRELERASEQDGQKWAKAMQELLLEANEATAAAGGCLRKQAVETFTGRYRKVPTKGGLECPAPAAETDDDKPGRVARSKSRNLLERLRTFETETLRFMTDPLVPFTKNQSENDIRMTKLQQEISGRFLSFEGAHIFCRVRSYLSSCRKHGVTATEALKTLFAGVLPDFIV